VAATVIFINYFVPIFRVVAMTIVCCPECGFTMSVRKLDEGSQVSMSCENCNSELLVGVADGEISINSVAFAAKDPYESYAGVEEEEED